MAHRRTLEFDLPQGAIQESTSSCYRGRSPCAEQIVIMRVILVPLAGDADDAAALAAAYTIAGSQGAHIEALLIRPDPIEAVISLEGEATPELIGNVTRATTATWDARSKLARQAFDAAQAAAGATLADQPASAAGLSGQWREITGGAEVVLTAQGRVADLIVLSGVHASGHAHRQRMFEVALLHVGRPLLLVPEQAPAAIGGTIALAWNGSTESARAVAGAMPLLHKAAQVHVLTAASTRTEVESADGLARYLGWHGVDCTCHPMYPSNQVGSALLAKAKELGADLLVMGGYGRSRLRELVFGGVTRTVLSQYELPLLLAH
jgi:nucleotide-binding universal stress UspA family protein